MERHRIGGGCKVINQNILTLTIALTVYITATLTRILTTRSFILAYRIMKLIIIENGNNAWLAHGTPHLNVRSDFMDTETGIKPKHAFGGVSNHVTVHIEAFIPLFLKPFAYKVVSFITLWAITLIFVLASK